jgi:hypothetical protein
MKHLPTHLDLTHYFDDLSPADPAMITILTKHPSSIATGDLGLALAEHGIFPALIVDVLREISRSLKRYQISHHLSSDLPIHVSYTNVTESPQTVVEADIMQDVMRVTDLEPEVAQRLLQWLYAVAAIKPKIIPGFIFKPVANGWYALPGGIYCGCINQLYETWSHIGN